jgi:N-methylhydantoinase B
MRRDAPSVSSLSHRLPPKLTTSIGQSLDAYCDLLFIGPYVVLQAAVQTSIMQNILWEPGESGINRNAMFIWFYPYSGALHQKEVTCVAPIFCGGCLMAWTGATIHLGGCRRSSSRRVRCRRAGYLPGTSADLTVKIVERGRIRKDIEREYVRRSHQPYLLGLDLRAMIAANNAVKSRRCN